MWTIGRLAHVVSAILMVIASQGLCDCSWEDCSENSQVQESEAALAMPSWDLLSLSETFGHLIGQELRNQQIALNVDAVIKGLRQELAGRPAPLTEQEYAHAMQQVKESHFKEVSERNLALADAFMASNAKKTGIIEVIP